jgi:hypothetical protein
MVTARNATGSLNASPERSFKTPNPPIITRLYSDKRSAAGSLGDFAWYILFMHGVDENALPTASLISQVSKTGGKMGDPVDVLKGSIIPTRVAGDAGGTTESEIASVGFNLSPVLNSKTDSRLQSLISEDPQFAENVSASEELFSKLGAASIYKLTVTSISGPGTIAPTLNAKTLGNAKGAFYERTLALQNFAYKGPAVSATSAVPALAFHASTEVRDDIYVFGGKTPTGLSDKLYKISRDDPTQWIEITASSAKGSACHQ